jgi:hypothetical protein
MHETFPASRRSATSGNTIEPPCMDITKQAGSLIPHMRVWKAFPPPATEEEAGAARTPIPES